MVDHKIMLETASYQMMILDFNRTKLHSLFIHLNSKSDYMKIFY